MEVARFYSAILADHLKNERQMAFVVGPRQVGKTTVCRQLADKDGYMDWDNRDDRKVFLAGPGAVAGRLGLDRARAVPPVVAFDELHKLGRWKGFLKGFFDTYGDNVRILVTGSSRLDVYRRGGDSLMGRYFLYRMHPLTVGEVARQAISEIPIRSPVRVAPDDFAALWEFGGYPEPFVRRNRRFSLRWQRLRTQQLVREDVRDLTRVQELGQMEILVTLLLERSASTLIMSNLASEIGVSVDTIRRWIRTLTFLHHGFLVRPWFTNVAKSLRKEPKWYLSDWSQIADVGARAETLVACHLLKAVQGWEDLGLGHFDLRYLRDRDKREVDFLVVRDRKPWFLVEVKNADTSLSPWLGHFQRQIKAPHAFQAVIDLSFEDVDCFKYRTPTIVPARTLLSQLL